MNTATSHPELHRILWCAFGSHPNDATGPHATHAPHLHHAYDHYGEIVLCPGGDYAKHDVYVREKSPEGDPVGVGYIVPK